MIYILLTRYLFEPVAWVLYLMIAAIVAGHYRREALRDRLLIAGAVLLACVMILPFDLLLARPLENEYPRPPLPAHIDGIVILDGSVPADVFTNRHVQGENSSTPRILAGADLAKRFPTATLIYSGTSTNDPRAKAAERATVQDILSIAGIAPGRTLFEQTSRDTGENLVNSMKLAHPRPGQTWILVTSALHMPRAMAVANRIGWRMVPWPSHYISTTSGGWFRMGPPADTLVSIDRALHEWIGLIVYRLSGRAR